MAILFTHPTKREYQAKAFGQPQGCAVFGHEQSDSCFKGDHEFDPIVWKRDQS